MVSGYQNLYSNVVRFTRTLNSYARKDQHHQALLLFQTTYSSSLPSTFLDPYVISSVIKSCTSSSRTLLAASLHAHAIKSSLLFNPFVHCSLLDMYGKRISIADARKLFDEIPERNVVAWNTIISLYARAGQLERALELFEMMDIAPDVSTFNSVITGLSATIEGWSDDRVMVYYRRMQDLGLKADLITLLGLLSASVGMASLCYVKEIHCFGMKNDVDARGQLSSGLVDAYGRCGSANYARSVFDCMKQKDVVAWSSLISAYATNGEARSALKIFGEMEDAKAKPDEITFLGVLKACSHAGLADEALHYFSRMHEDYKLKVTGDHYSCLVDVLSRNGRLYEAYEVLRGMSVKATSKAWGALLGACRNYGEAELAEIAGMALREVEPSNCANYVLLGRIYSGMGRYEEAQKIRSEMNEKGVKATRGNSWIV